MTIKEIQKKVNKKMKKNRKQFIKKIKRHDKIQKKTYRTS